MLAGDLICVSVGNVLGPGTTTVVPVRVAGDGTAAMPYLPKAVPVAGMSDAGAAGAVAKAYREANVVERAPVRVRRLLVAGTGDPAVVPAGPIGTYDLLRVAVGQLTGPLDAAVLVRERVDGEGMFALPYVGRLKLAGLSDQQAAAAVVEAYERDNIIKSAPVSVLRLEAAPPGAGRVDLPDVPIYPVPQWLWWLYETADSPRTARGAQEPRSSEATATPIYTRPCNFQTGPHRGNVWPNESAPAVTGAWPSPVSEVPAVPKVFRSPLPVYALLLLVGPVALAADAPAG